MKHCTCAVPGFHEAMQQYILGALCSTCQMVAKETLSQSLRLDDSKTDELVRTKICIALGCTYNCVCYVCADPEKVQLGGLEDFAGSQRPNLHIPPQKVSLFAFVVHVNDRTNSSCVSCSKHNVIKQQTSQGGFRCSLSLSNCSAALM